ncbi:MAG: thioredoxin family protein [Candidatus Hodarchaeales archaeon]|jgi:hypothetical protein
MKKQDSFNRLFGKGISYQEYVNKSDKYRERMNTSLLTARKVVQKLNQDQISQMNEKLHVLCIAENWCIDCANGVPIIFILSDMVPNWDFRIASREDWKEEFELFYTTAGRKKIPVIIFADEDGDEIMRWVERPTKSYQLLGTLKDQNLPKNDFIQKYSDTLEFKPPIVSNEIFSELIFVAEKSALIVHVNSPSGKG